MTKITELDGLRRKPQRRTTSLSIPEDLLEAVDKIAKEENVTRSVLVQFILNDFVNKYNVE